MADVQLLAELEMSLGECPRWNAVDQSWYWIDILAGDFYQYHQLTQMLNRRTFDFLPACFAFTDRNEIVMSGSKGLYLLSNFNAEPAFLSDPESELPHQRFNDGVTSPSGHFIAGTIGDGESATGTVYELAFKQGKLEHRELQSQFQIINGQAFSPDGKYYYVTDTPKQVIWRHDYQPATASFGDAEVFYQCEPDEYPDGAAVDQDGNYWVAMYGSGKISVISPTGKKLKDILLPVSQPTMIAFGGEQLSQLIVTSARQNLSADALRGEPNAGSVFTFEAEAKGTLPAQMKHG